MVDQIELYGKQIPYEGGELWMLGDSFGSKVYSLDIKAIQEKQNEIPQEKLVEMLKKMLENQKELVAEAHGMNSLSVIVTVGGLTESIKNAETTIKFLEKAVPLLR